MRLIENAWNQYWQQGLPFEPRSAGALPPITGVDVMEVVDRMNPHKASGAAKWSVLELRTLAPQLLQALAQFFETAEAAGRWPPELTVTLIALIPKDGA